MTPRSIILTASLLSLAASQPSTAADRAPWHLYSHKPDAWYKTPEGAHVTANILSHQSPLGDWDKNFDSSQTLFTGDRSKLKGTFDNDATLGELRYLARAFRATANPETKAAFLKGLDHILAAQYPTGGWPQSFPPGKGYNRYITYNDDTMVNLMVFVQDVATNPSFTFINPQRRTAAQHAFDAGIRCILACQIKVDGVLTVWCAQHDERTLAPRPARSYELVSLSGAESARILLLLMSLENPTPEVRQAITSGARWFDRSQLAGLRLITKNGDKQIIQDPTAPPLWARFYEIDTNRPIFSGRNGIKKYNIAEIEPERRNGYAWYGTWGSKVASAYLRWSAKNRASS